MKLKEVAAKIDAHLSRFEADPKINALSSSSKIHPYYNACAYVAGRYVGIRYVSFQSTDKITKAEAEVYLAWLDAGNVGKHYRMGKS